MYCIMNCLMASNIFVINLIYVAVPAKRHAASRSVTHLLFVSVDVNLTVINTKCGYAVSDDH